MSGSYSLPFVLCHPSELSGLVAVAPVGIPRYRTQLQDCAVPVLAIWGDRDRVVPPSQADQLIAAVRNGRTLILSDAQHPCYLAAPDEFHRHIADFARSLPIDA